MASHDDGWLQATEAWHAGYPGAVVAALRITLRDPELASARSEQHVAEIELDLRHRFGAMDRTAIRATEPFAAYDTYYRSFGQTYHVWHQVESVVVKGRPIRRSTPFVETVFSEELRSGILSCCHDASRITYPLTVDVGAQVDPYRLYNGTEATVREGDMCVRDKISVLSSIIVGPAERAQVVVETRQALVYVYAPPAVGEEAVLAHLDAIERELVEQGGPTTTIERRVLVASGQ